MSTPEESHESEESQLEDQSHPAVRLPVVLRVPEQPRQVQQVQQSEQSQQVQKKEKVSKKDCYLCRTNIPEAVHVHVKLTNLERIERNTTRFYKNIFKVNQRFHVGDSLLILADMTDAAPDQMYVMISIIGNKKQVQLKEKKVNVIEVAQYRESNDRRRLDKITNWSFLISINKAEHHLLNLNGQSTHPMLVTVSPKIGTEAYWKLKTAKPGV